MKKPLESEYENGFFHMCKCGGVVAIIKQDGEFIFKCNNCNNEAKVEENYK